MGKVLEFIIRIIMLILVLILVGTTIVMQGTATVLFFLGYFFLRHCPDVMIFILPIMGLFEIAFFIAIVSAGVLAVVVLVRAFLKMFLYRLF